MKQTVIYYIAAKHLHVACVVLSISLFLLRGILQLRGIAWRRSAALRIAPHVIDTVLLSSALWMVVASHQYPFVQSWLTAKLIMLLVYIGFGKIALGRNTDERYRLPAFVAALTSVGYIVGVALTHSATWGMA
ncbi:MAG TPA: SirB2 family protein [Rhodocyclaceae bacterium]|nr:SirB2 family protein [Rhodocyclaceae bacterium]